LTLYLSIEQVRFRDRLQVEISADPATLDVAVPQMVLQPVGENAIRHVVGKCSSPGRVKISAVRLNDALELRVQDDGPGFLSEGFAGGQPNANQRIGIANTRARLQQLYGEQARLTTGNAQPRGAVVTITLPYHPRAWNFRD
jgi:two-component system LytT family sensor kinase